MPTDKILIFGNGQIGNFYQRYFSLKNIISVINEADICQPDQIEKAILDFQPSVVINTAAWTNLEWCNTHRLETFNSNVLGADNVAQACDKHHLYFIHFSSGCIMASRDENDARKETDTPQPISYYSWTKVWSENLISFKKSPDFKYLILRPRQPVSAQINQKNMLIKLLTFTKFIDTPNSGTVIEDLMDWTLKLMQKRVTGVINVANKGWTTPYEIGLLLKKYVLPTLPVNKITKEELNKLTPEKRVDTILDVTRLESLLGPVKPYKIRLEEIIQELAKNFKTEKPEVIKSELEATVEQSRQRTVVNDQWPKLLQR